MMIYTLKFDKKKAAFAVVLLALVIVAVILLVGTAEQGSKTAKTAETKGVPSARVKTEKARVDYLKSYGWSVETPAISEKTVVIPKQFNEVFENYNKLQKMQGFDLSNYRGMEVTQYTFRVPDSDISENVYAVLYVSEGKVIGGDVHSTELDGFICGIIQNEK